MDDLFSEEGFSQQVAAVCIACGAEMAAGAVLCTKCGYNKETGERLQSHKVDGIDVDHGTLALQKAEQDMEKAKAAQEDMLGKAELPWWALGLILFMIASATTIAVIAINVSRREDGEGSFNALATFLMMAGCAFCLVFFGSVLGVVLQAFQKDHKLGFWKRSWKLMATAVVTGGAAGGFFAAASAQGFSFGE